MSLDVHLFQFKNLDTDTVLELSRLTEELDNIAEAREKLLAKVREVGLPEKIISDYSFGGEQVSFQSKKYPEWEVGDWYRLGTIRAILTHFTGQGLDFVFPEAKDIHGHGFFRPHWTDANMRLAEILEKLKKHDRGQIDKVCLGLSRSFDLELNQIGAMIETLDYVLESGNPKQFLLYWSE
jgi:hypothetical protein